MNHLTETDKSELILAAMMDWFRTGSGALSMDGSSVEELSGIRYVLLSLEGEVSGVYRVGPDDLILRRVELLPEVHSESKHTKH